MNFRRENQKLLSSARPPDNSTMTAASLIDAIITHQINQPTEAGVPAATPTSSSSSHSISNQKLGDKFLQVN